MCRLDCSDHDQGVVDGCFVVAMVVEDIVSVPTMLPHLEEVNSVNALTAVVMIVAGTHLKCGRPVFMT